MKHITLSLVVVCTLCFGNSLLAQQAATSNNGRAVGAAAGVSAVETPAPTTQRVDETRQDDRDIPGEVREPQADLFLPQAIDELRDELYNSASVPEVVAEVEALKAVLLDVQANQEKLQRENEVLRKQLNSCCNASSQGLTAKDAYLLQNAPNPFQATTKLEYFVPDNVGAATLEIRDLKGTTLQSFNLGAKGLGSIQLDGAQWPAGTYVYFLVVEEEIIDSKVMMIK